MRVGHSRGASHRQLEDIRDSRDHGAGDGPGSLRTIYMVSCYGYVPGVCT
jgi:hypothetical protein